jgi:exopolysaccharide biosynthesis WecB/TagA/CpsF family protein
MKVLLVHNYYQQPGGEDVVYEQERKLLESRGHRVVSYERRNSELLSYSALQRLFLPAKTIWAGDAYRDVLDLIRQEEPDIAHVHNTFVQISPSVFAACRQGGVPVVQTLHNFRLICPAANLFRNGKVCEDCEESGLWQSVRHACYRGSVSATASTALMLAVHRTAGTWCDGVTGYIALSEFSKRKLVGAGLPKEKIHVKPNFVAPDPGPKPQEDLGDYTVYVGRLSAEKGVETLVRSWCQLSTRIPLQIIGDGPLRSKLEQMASQCSLSNVVFTGRLNSEETRSRIRGARLLILPSVCYENFPMAVVEAFSCGTPVVCSRHGAMQEIVSDGVNGLLFTPGKPEELAAALEWAWCHPEQVQRMGEAARQEYEEKYTAERNYQALMAIYREIMESPNEDRRLPIARSVYTVSDGHVPTPVATHSRQPAIGNRPSLTGNPQPAVGNSFKVLGVRVDAVQIPEVISRVRSWVEQDRKGNYVAVTGMHGVVEAQQNPEFNQVLNRASLVVADGMPLVWIGRRYGFKLQRRVYGPELLESFCRETGDRYCHFFYGGAPGVAQKLGETLKQRFGIRVGGVFSPPFRPLNAEEERQLAELVRTAQPDLLWVGLSTPKQETWMAAYRDLLNVPVMLGVGAAFDFLTGRTSQAPLWMREHGLEWFFRLATEPRRLWRRYLLGGSKFLWNVALEMASIKKYT